MEATKSQAVADAMVCSKSLANQTDEMRAKHLRLVVPRGLHATYRPTQQVWLMDVAGFLGVVRDRQEG